MASTSLADKLLNVVRAGVVGSLLTMRVVATPSSASRPRVGKFGTYYEKAYSTWKAECQKQTHSAKPPIEGPVAALVEILVARPKTTKLDMPAPDVDNFVKGVLDGMTQASVWGDDKQVQILIATKRWTEPGEEPGAIVHVGAMP